MTIFVKLLFSILLLLGPTAMASDEQPTGYRGPPYKAPTPLSVPGGTTLFFAEDVQSLIADTDILLINVSPITLAPADADGKRHWVLHPTTTKQQIPGSIWLPNVGYESLQPAMLDYFGTNLMRLTDGDKARALLFYCTADCWMSWNSVKRARQVFGYHNLYWYPFGIDGWKEQDLELEVATPVEFE